MRQAAVISVALLSMVICACGSAGDSDDGSSSTSAIPESSISEGYNSASGKYVLESSEGTNCISLGLPEEIHIDQDGYNIQLTDKNGESVISTTDLCVYECADLVPDFSRQCDAVMQVGNYGSYTCMFTVYTGMGMKVGCIEDFLRQNDERSHERCELTYVKELMVSAVVNIPDEVWLCTRLIYE